MSKKDLTSEQLIDNISRNLFLVLPLFRKRLLHMDAIQREFSVPLSHAMVMGLLADNGPMNISEISRNLGVAKPNITPLIDKLTAEGFVERQRDEIDRRIVNVSLCPEGAEILTQIRKKVNTLVASWATPLTADELKELDGSLQTIYKLLGNALPRSRE